jgi:hypothetical protein
MREFAQLIENFKKFISLKDSVGVGNSSMVGKKFSQDFHCHLHFKVCRSKVSITRRNSEFITDDHSVNGTILVITEKQRSLQVKKKQNQGEKLAAEMFHCTIRCIDYVWTCIPQEHRSSRAMTIIPGT